MLALIRDIYAVIGRHKKFLIMFTSITVIVLIMFSIFFKYKTTQSSFCDSCHYMDPYVRHWEASSHSEVDCIKCHNYGLIDLAGATIKYVTNTYDSRPKAIVDDENCLTSDCHDKQNLDQQETFRNNINFNHSIHLEQPLRGEELRCTSCHNQIVQYNDDSKGHMSVNDKSCFICHFKDAGVGEAITGCNSCHGIPEKQVEHAGFIFNHEPYLKLDVECKQCHIDIVKGDGAVPESKCHTCHVERYPNEYSQQQLHAIHITENGIDCYKCHTDIEHGNFSMVSSLEINCENCHLRQHNQPKQLYMGIGGKNGTEMPSDMFTAQVSCNGCHTHITPEGEIMAHQEKKEAARNSCVTCHGEGYDLMFDNWLAGSKKVLKDYNAYMKLAKIDFKNVGGSKKARRNVQAVLSRMESNYIFLKGGKIAHNIQYAIHLLNNSADEFSVAMKTIKKAYKAPNHGNGLKPGNNCDTFCHGKTQTPEYVNYDGDELPHQLHIEDMELTCDNCHSTTEHGKISIQESICSDCH